MITKPKKRNIILENIIFPLLLLCYPLLKINQGIDVSDSLYSLGNYLFFDRLQGTWVISTYLSNVLGFLLTRLPGGETLLCMNLYTGLFLSMLVLICYFALKKQMSAWMVFWGEMLAIGFTWIPTGILYNYMTYFFLSAGCLFLYRGIVQKKNALLFMAGFFLGMNVLVRFPNLLQASLIVVLWYGCFLQKEKTWIQKTLFCIGGYLTGVAIPSVAIGIQYGFCSLTDMIAGLFSMQSSDETYSLLSMVTSVLKAYGKSFIWVFCMIAAIFCGILLFRFKQHKYLIGKKILYCLLLGVMLRFFWGRGMFSFRYYEDYTSMYEWGMTGLYLTLICVGLTLFEKTYSDYEKIMAFMVLMIIILTPLGSNNYTYQNLNNLFLVMPFTVSFICGLIKKMSGKMYFPDWMGGCDYPIRTILILLLAVLSIQTIGFHAVFVFRDGMQGEKRDTVMTGTKTADKMWTNQENAKQLTGLIQYCQEEELTGTEAVFYGDAPGLTFLLQMPSALSTSWADLDSYALSDFEEELQKLAQGNEPLIIIRNFDPATDMASLKKDILLDFIMTKHYNITYENEGYRVYSPDR